MEINIEKARELVNKYLKDKNNQIHSRESEVVLRAIAKEMGEDEDVWALAGLLHDLDWEQISQDYENHGIKTMDIIEKENYEISSEIKQAIASHNEQYTKVKRQKKLDFALSAGESVTGLIYAYALMRPERLIDMQASSLNKKFKDQKFAANVSREMIDDIAEIGLDRMKFFDIAIKAMREISSEIGF